jgi:5-methyltetrahydrofolate--homocysteine methyltransferase
MRDWQALEGVYEEFWNGRNTRGIINCSYTRPGKDPESLAKSWMPAARGWTIAVALDHYIRTGDKSCIPEALDYVEAGFGNVGYAAEGFPAWWFNLGPGVVAAFLTGFSRFVDHSVWFELDQPMDFAAIRALDPVRITEYASKTREVAGMIVERFGGKVLLSQTDLGGVVDILASLRRTEQLLFDCADSANDVKSCLPIIESSWLGHFRHFDKVFSAANDGARSSWIPLLSREAFYPSQCDFCYMISPDMFREFVFHSLARESKAVGRIVYHLDGPGEVPHLDMICSIPEIRVVQWTAGAGEVDVWDEKWFPLYKRIIDHGKKIFLFYHGDESLIRRLYSKFPAKEFCLSIYAPDEDAARRIEAL